MQVFTLSELRDYCIEISNLYDKLNIEMDHEKALAMYEDVNLKFNFLNMAFISSKDLWLGDKETTKEIRNLLNVLRNTNFDIKKQHPVLRQYSLGHFKPSEDVNPFIKK